MKKKIIVPVDFSKNSYNTYIYALSMAEDFDCRVELLHFYNPLTSDFKADGIDEEQVMDALEEELSLFANSFRQEESSSTVMTKTEVSTKILTGLVVPQLIERSIPRNVFMMILGTKDNYDGTKYLFGSIPSELAQNAFCPVMLIPKGVTYRFFDNILFASNLESSNSQIIDKVSKIATKHSSAMHFVQVTQKGEKEDFDMVKNKIFEQLFSDYPPNFSVNISTVKAESIVNGLNQYADENNVDLIILVNKHRGFLTNILRKSVSRNMALNNKNPLLIYHVAR